ncbi:CNNM domain-containing protein [Halomontanus rarus]|uniref:CNNM domain-containing protein n=1 Tax=Halomontanus rarus TaxID=3034020 RepID=UPI001A98F43F
MVDVVFSLGRLFAALFLVFLNGFFVAAEFAFVRIRSTRVDAMAEEGGRTAGMVKEAMENLDDYLAVTQLGITLASLSLGWIGEPAVAALISPILEGFLPEDAIHLTAVILGFSVITFLHVVFGELAPKTIAIQEAERIALIVAVPMKFFYYLFIPGIIVFNGTANFFTRMIGISPASESAETLSEEEIMLIVGRSGDHGTVATDEVEMIEAVFDLDDTITREVMVPRPDVVSVPATLSLAELRTVVGDTGHTRYPVLDEENDDQIVGFVDTKDIVRAGERGDADGTTVTAGDLARDLLVVPETRPINELLVEFQDQQGQIAAVIDEWGAFEGIVTVEDIVEVLVGDLRDEFDRVDDEPSIDELEGGSYSIDGGTPIQRVNETLETEFESDEVETIGGLVLSHLGRAPAVGDSVEQADHVLRVDEVDGARISSVTIDVPHETKPKDGGKNVENVEDGDGREEHRDDGH